MNYSFKDFILLLFMISFFWSCEKDDSVEIVSFSDTELLSSLLKQGIDTNHDGLISVREAENIQKISILAANIGNLNGLESFPNLDSLILKMVPLKKIDVSAIVRLRYFECTMCKVTNLDLSANYNLEEINCEKNQIEILKLPPGQVLKKISCGYNRLRELNTSENPELVYLQCYNNQITSLDLSNNLQLTRMVSCGNQLTSLDVSKNKFINVLGVGSMPMLTEVYVWTLPFPPEGVKVIMPYSPRINFMLAN